MFTTWQLFYCNEIESTFFKVQDVAPCSSPPLSDKVTPSPCAAVPGQGLQCPLGGSDVLTLSCGCTQAWAHGTPRVFTGRNLLQFVICFVPRLW